MYHANDLLEWLLTRTPIQKERIRYVSESGGTMIAFCCIFIIASCQTFTAIILNVHEILNNVNAAARLMMDLSPDEENTPYYQGSLVLRPAEALRMTLEHRNR